MKIGTPGFNGNRLAEARKSLMLTKTALAEMIDVSKASIGQYEKGIQNPRPEIFEKLTSTLNKPKNFFLSDNRNIDFGSTFFRSLSSTTKSEREMAKVKLLWISDIVTFLEKYIEFPKLDIPDFSISNPFSLSTADIEDLAEKCRAHWNLDHKPVSNIVALLESKGFIVTRWETSSKALDAFNSNVKDGGRPYVVLSADKTSSARSRLDASHEIGHSVLHKDINLSVKNHKEAEKQAFYFAGAFLLPEREFAKDIAKFGTNLESFWTIKEKWKVSIAAMIYRCKHLNLISDDQEKRLYISISKRGWRKKEPLDDRIKIEKPYFLAESIKMLVDNNILSKREIVDSIMLSSSDIVKLTGLPRYYFNDDNSKVKTLPILKKREYKSPNKKRGKVLSISRNGQ